MDCKILKKTLFISILAISLFYTGEVRAAQKCTTTYTSTSGVSKTTCKITIDKIKQNAKFYEFTLDGEVALCLNAGKNMFSGYSYALENTIPVSNSWLIKAYEYAEQNVNDLTARIAAQTVTWYITQVNDSPAATDLKAAVCSAISSAKNSCSGSITGTCESAFTGIESMSGTSSIYTWREYNGKDVQRILAKPSKRFKQKVIGGNLNVDVNASLNKIFEQIPGDTTENTTCEKDCNIITEVNEASCGTSSFTSNSSSGRIYQQATGSTCEYGIDADNAITYDGENIKSPSSVSNDKYQIHCFSEFNQEYPGNVTTPVSVGRYLVWPNNNINPNVIKAGLQEYPLKLRYSKICKMDVDSDTLKKDYKTVKNALDTTISNVSQSDNGKTGYNYFKNSSSTPSKRSCGDTNNTNTLAGKWSNAKTNYEDCVTRETASCQAECGTESTCSDSMSGESQRECQEHNNQISACKNGCQSKQEGSNGTCNDSAHGYLYDIYDAYDQQYTACKSVATAHKAVNDQLILWKNIITTSNTFPGISVSKFSANITVQYTLHPESSVYNKEFTLQKVKADDSSITSIDNKNTKTGLTLDPLMDSIDNFNKDVNDNSKEISDKKATIYRTVWYDLNEATGKKNKLPSVNFSSVRKTSVESINKNNISDSDRNHITTIGFVNLPIPFGAEVGTEKLILTITSLSGTDITSEIRNAVVNKKYTCTYNIISTPSSSCECPENTDKAGTNLLGYIKNNNMTCSEAQQKYCNNGDNGDDDGGGGLYCPDGTRNAGYSLDGCIGSGGTYDSCKSQLCDQDLKCPESANATDTMSLQFRNCVSVKINQGMSLSEAKAACNVFCTSKGQKIIYRTISLSNPFPSYDSDETVTQNNLTVGMFNDNIKGRYPGMNWNSTTTVKNKILNNRGVDGDKVYTKTPLYTFKLDAGTIQAIRKYNKNHKYSDFKLDCKKGNAAACISTFVHSSTSGRTGTGTCDKTLNKKTFYTCDD